MREDNLLCLRRRKFVVATTNSNHTRPIYPNLARGHVWTPDDFADLGPRTAVDQALHRLVASKHLRRIARGLYDTPQPNPLTGKPNLYRQNEVDKNAMFFVVN